jgi:hypothetical protein
VRELGLEFFEDVHGRHSSYPYYSIKLRSYEVIDKRWLVYSEELDKVSCFCCKLFKSNQSRFLLSSDGLRDRNHFSGRIQEHERNI